MSPREFRSTASRRIFPGSAEEGRRPPGLCPDLHRCCRNGGFLARCTRLGIYAAALGGNEEALRRNGAATRLYKTVLYVVCGMCAALASVILTSKLNSAEPLAGTMVEMNAIATVVLGGTKIRGGAPRIVGTSSPES